MDLDYLSGTTYVHKIHTHTRESTNLNDPSGKKKSNLFTTQLKGTREKLEGLYK